MNLSVARLGKKSSFQCALVLTNTSMPGKDESLHWQDKRLDAKEQGVYDPYGVDHVIEEP